MSGGGLYMGTAVLGVVGIYTAFPINVVFVSGGGGYIDWFVVSSRRI